MSTTSSTTTTSTSQHSSPLTSPKSPSSTTTAASSSTSSTTLETPTPTTSSPTKVQSAIESLSSILPSSLSPSLSSSPSAAFLLNSPAVSSQISTLLHHPSSGSGDNHLCRWFYDTFQSSDPSLQLVVLRFIPLISGLYLTRVTHHRPLAGFEAVLLAIYAHETTSRHGQPVSVTVPDLSNPSIYHENSLFSQRSHNNNNSTDLNIAVVSSSLEPHGTVRSTRRARIVGVAMELFFTKIWVMPLESKLEFCDLLEGWAGGEDRVALPWELLQPCLRILGHCLLGDNENDKGELHDKASRACKCLYERAMHDVNPKAILAVGSLLRVVKMEREVDSFDPTEIPPARIISL